MATVNKLTRREFLKLSGNVCVGAMLTSTFPESINKQFSVVRSKHAAPNILLIVLDTVRAQSMGLYGYVRSTTPNFSKIAQRGVVFEKAFSNSSWTLPSHVAMFTSRYPYELGIDFNVPLNNSVPTVAEFFLDMGYDTAAFVGNNRYCSTEWGLDRGFEHFEDYLISPWQMLLSSSITKKMIKLSQLQKMLRNSTDFDLKQADRLNQDFLHWLGKRTSKKPFFAFLNYYDAHDPYVPPENFALRYSEYMPNGYVEEDLKKTLDPIAIHELNDAYDGTISFLDDQISDLISHLDNQGVMEDTVVIITSDHGEQFGEHNLLVHGNSLYTSVLWVPLIMILPNTTPSDILVTTKVSLIDIPATLFRLVRREKPSVFTGNPLQRFWEMQNTETIQETIFSEILTPLGYQGNENAAMKSIINQNWHYIWKANAPEELFDLSTDPSENLNLAGETDYAELLAQMRVKLTEFGNKK